MHCSVFAHRLQDRCFSFGNSVRVAFGGRLACARGFENGFPAPQKKLLDRETRFCASAQNARESQNSANTAKASRNRVLGFCSKTMANNRTDMARAERNWGKRIGISMNS